jgi:predicted metal-dependent enzyme (double-stranded beta helix superfamily)
MPDLHRLRRFIGEMTTLVSRPGSPDQDVLKTGEGLLADLVSHDDWLPDSMAQCPPHGYVQNLLWCDPLERFSVVSFVWAPSARTPIHDHQVWGMVGMLRGSETSQRFVRDSPTGALRKTVCLALAPGNVELLVPAAGDIHQVTNALTDCGSISIHVYGGNIGAVRRHTFDEATGQAKPFVSGYSNRTLPNLWDRLSEERALS